MGRPPLKLEAEVAEKRCSDGKEPHCIWKELEGGKPAHKKTILRIFMDPALDVDYNKSHDRLLRVRYFSIGGDNCDRSKSTPYPRSGSTGDNLFALGSLYATLVCINTDRVCVAILKCTSLKSASQYLEEAPVDEIALPESKYDISGQIFSLIPVPADSLNASTISWIWNSHYVALNTAKARSTKQTSTARLHHLSFAVNGRLVYPLPQCLRQP